MRYVSYVDFATHRRATVMTRLCLYKKKLKKKKKKKTGRHTFSFARILDYYPNLYASLNNVIITICKVK
jgi:hypothetical protein